MTSQQIADMQHNIYESLLHRHLQEAFARLRTLANNLQEWNTNQQLDELETSYRYMIQYMVDGVDDPGRTQVYNRLLTQTYTLTDTICEKMQTVNAMTKYYGLKRFLAKEDRSLPKVLWALDNSVNELSLCELIPENNAVNNKRKEVERLADEMFNLIWTNYPAEPQDYAALREIFQPHHLPESVVALMTSALSLNLIHCFDDEKLDILIDAYTHHDSSEVQIRALCGIIITTLRYHSRLHLYDKIRSRISLLLDDSRFTTDTRNILFQFIRTRDTEKIARKMTEELLPKMMKISPDLYKKIKEDDALSEIDALEGNPEWQELLDTTGISENLMELNDLQRQGADVFMSTFSHLKGFPFFSNISNWFLPFMTNHTAISEIWGDKEWGANFSAMLRSSGFLCNSDKYSFCLSLSQVPDSQRKMMASQFGTENRAMQEETQAELYRQSKERENISNRYIQDLYRFHKLYPRRNEFYDIFSMPIERLMQIDEFSTVTNDEKLLKILSEYFFKNQYYKDAIYIYSILARDNYTDSQLYQKCGYCHQSLGNYEEALECYLKADLIKPENMWILQHIAICYRNMKKNEIALDYFMRACELAPDNISINLNIGHCYLEQKQYDKALQYYFKVDFLDTKGTKARRPIAWCSFLAGKTEQASNYYEKILSDKPNALDFLNAGHTQLAMKNIKKAIELYIDSIRSDNNDTGRFTNNFNQDIPDLIRTGVNPEDIPIIYDQVIYQWNEAGES